ncbi:hypothetical protein GCM10010287_50450 [Streptomyces variabilis]|uniref:Integral membrane protein n=2 Tax=Streptomyces variabilis TaxID=67372 RepID=A0ABQ2U6C8_9ACTN|nr:hypothetical protein GCM10010265_05560 [Streptomyces griseoincarnatus]GGT69769.1 hypothetical protein GCM10010287_50450 [Streptomyces variabilis]
MGTMLLPALLLVLATGAFAAVAVVENFSGSPEYAVEIFGNQIATLTAPGLFLSGVGLTLIFCLGLTMLVAGLKRRRRVHRVPTSAPAPQMTGEGEKVRPQPSRLRHRRRGRHIFGH